MINMMLTYEGNIEAGKFKFKWLRLNTFNYLNLCFVAEKAYEFITDGGKKKMNYELFSEFLRKFFTNDEANHALNLGLD
jgi:hypothetical protein